MHACVQGTTPTMLGTNPAVLGTNPPMLGTTPTMLGTNPLVLGTNPPVLRIGVHRVLPSSCRLLPHAATPGLGVSLHYGHSGLPMFTLYPFPPPFPVSRPWGGSGHTL